MYSFIAHREWLKFKLESEPSRVTVSKEQKHHSRPVLQIHNCIFYKPLYSLSVITLLHLHNHCNTNLPRSQHWAHPPRLIMNIKLSIISSTALPCPQAHSMCTARALHTTPLQSNSVPRNQTLLGSQTSPQIWALNLSMCSLFLFIKPETIIQN